MRKQFSKIAQNFAIPLILLIGAIGVQTMVSCSIDDGNGGNPGNSSNSSAGEPKYCIYLQEQLCILSLGTQTDCPSGGILSNACPYSSSSVDVSSSSAGASSSGSAPSSSSSATPSSSSSSVAVFSSSTRSSSSGSALVTSSGSGAEAECKDSQARQLYCEWAGQGCYVIDARYAEPAGQTCAALVANCIGYGGLYTGVTGLNENNGYGTGVKCADNGGIMVGISANSSSSSVAVSSPNSSSSSETLCNGKPLTASQFCYNNKAREKCGGTLEYNPATEECCGSSKYTIATQFCYNSPEIFNRIGNFCGNRTTQIYNPDKYECRPKTNPNGVYLKGGVSDESKTYNAVLIGTQTWMAENLNYNAENSVCYNGEPANCAIYGRLYDWSTAKTACPSGWHLPKDDEWGALVQFVNPSCSSTDKRCEYVDLEAVSWGDIDKYGFTALPGGYGYVGGLNPSVGYYHYFTNMLLNGFWWSATEYSSSEAYFLLMNYGTSRGTHSKYDVFSVRCLKDN